MQRYAAGDDAVEMAEVGIDVQADAMEAYPTPQLHADGGHLVFAPVALRHPDADAALAHLAGDAQPGQRANDPGLQRLHERPHVATARRKVKHHVGHSLARPVVRELAAPPGAEHREPPWVQQVGGPGGNAGGVERRVLEQPDQFARLCARDRIRSRFHSALGVRVGHETGGDRPAGGRGVGAKHRGSRQGLA